VRCGAGAATLTRSGDQKASGGDCDATFPLRIRARAPGRYFYLLRSHPINPRSLVANVVKLAPLAHQRAFRATGAPRLLH
jgi:hypothetical protein